MTSLLDPVWEPPRMQFHLSPSLTTVRALLFVLFSIAGPTSVQGGLITTLLVDKTTEPNGVFLYQYALINHEESRLPLVSFLLSVPPNADLRNITGPEGWGISYTPGDPAVVWFSPDETFDLLPGNGALFTFTSPLDEGTSSFQITGLDPSNSEIVVVEGEIAGPGMPVVPEPSTLTSGVLAALVLAGFRWSRRKRAA